LGDEVIENARLRIGDTDLAGLADMVLGADFFLSHRVYVAKSQKKIYFTYNGGRVFDLSKPLDASTDAVAADPSPVVDPAVNNNSEAPKDAAAFRRRGSASLSRNDIRSALADFDQAIKLDPNDAENFRQRALAKMAKDDFLGAKQDFDQALALSPKSTVILTERGMMHVAAKELNLAVDDFGRAMQLSPSDYMLGIRLASMFAQSDNQPEEILMLDRWLELFPKHARTAYVLNERCWARAVTDKELDLALADCDASIALGPNRSNFDSRGLVHLRRKDPERSIDDYKKALKLNRKSPSSLYGLGLATIQLGDRKKGLKYIDQALEINANVGETYKKMGLEP
jgi:tetratricopeptide (TPR) repeat protein